MGDTFNFNGSIGQFIKEGNGYIEHYHAQSVAASPSPNGGKDFATSSSENSKQAKTSSGYLNENLATDEAKAELAKYQKAGFLDEFYQPINLTRPQMGCIVIKIGGLLGLESQWKDFGCLWNIDSELLRTQFGRGKDSEPTRRFYKRIYDI